LKKNAKDDNELEGLLSSFITKEKTTKDNDELGFQLVIFFCYLKKTHKK